MLALAVSSVAFTAPPVVLNTHAVAVSSPTITMGMNTRDSGPKKKAGAKSTRALMGYRVGMRAPASAVKSGTTQAK